MIIFGWTVVIIMILAFLAGISTTKDNFSRTIAAIINLSVLAYVLLTLMRKT